MEFELFFLFLLSSLAVPALSLSSDGLALLSLKSAVDSSPAASTAFSDWNDLDADPCKWTGVSCSNSSSSGDPRVVALSLAARSLSGYVPSELGNLVYLRRLNLHGNSFHGSLPAQLFNATSLHSLYLYDNNFSGQIPPSMCNLPRLQNLDLSRNSFTGPITKGLRNCHQLQRLVLAGNKLSGNIPTGIWSHLTDLVRLDLSSNDLTGPIPVDLGELQSLSETLNLSFNHLTGKIPRSLANLPMTVSFDLRSNNLSGEIPQTGSFASQGPTAFLNNPSLCGFPLQKSCNSPGTAASTPDSSQHGQTSKHRGLDSGTIVLISTADAAAVAFVGLIIIYIYWKKKDDSNSCSCTGRTKLGGHNHETNSKFCACFGRSSGNESEVDSEKGSGVGVAGSGSNGGGGGEGELVAIDKSFSFELDELLRASAYVLGKSGLGIVYKVVLGNGVPVAVRRLGEGGEQRYKEFSAEIDAIGKVKHPNIVRLRAYYWAPDEKLLISDFVSNGNLATALQGKTGQLAGSSITWSTRLRIAKGTARGLAYLHECSPRKFVHGDIKPTNILLDNEFHPHISDFGLSRLIHITGTDPSSSGGFVGSALPYIKPPPNPEKWTAYKAPEARIPGTRPTQKWDVYSFGVVLLQLLTGKSPELTSTSSSSEIQDLVKWVRKGFEDEIPLSEMVDPPLLQEVHAKKEVLAVFHLALGCTEADPEIRPRMKSLSDNLDRLGS